MKKQSSIKAHSSVLYDTGSIPVDSIIIEGGMYVMEMILNGIIGATIGNFMKNAKKKINILTFIVTLCLAVVVAES